jgi:hypothetical protein
MHGFSQMFYRLTAALSLVCLLTCLPLAGCSETQHVPLGECGNHIVEAGEDCDGGSSCNAACRLTCSTKEMKFCPTGWGCDESEGVCRAASGQFEVVVMAAASDATLQVADFDGDGRDDLLTFNPNGELSSVYYFDRGQAIERTVNLPAATAAATANMTGDAAPDILLSSDLAASAFRSMPSRSFSPLVGALRQLPDPAKLLAADLDCDGLRDIMLLGGDSDSTLSRVDSNGELEPLSGNLAIGAAELLELEASTSALVPAPEMTATGEFAYAGRECEMLALPAPTGVSAIDVYASRDEGASIQRVARVTYPDSGETPVRWLFTDYDGDGNQDLILATQFGDQWVSYGFGDGTFAPTVAVIDSAFGEIFAAGELDGKLGTDFFSAYSTPALYYQARALDLTGDARTDVAAVGPQRRIDVYRGHQSGLMSRLSVPLRGIPHIEDTGDFDGDGIWDLLLSEAEGDGNPRKTASVLFAPVTSATGGAVELASFERIQQLTAGYLRRDLSEYLDDSTDIGVLFTQKGEHEDEGVLQLGFLEGGADRLLRSRLPTGKGQGYYYNSGSPAIGHFHDSDKLELALLRNETTFDEQNMGSQVSTAVDLLTVSVDGISFVRNLSLPDLDFQPPYLSANSGVAALDLDGDGLDEIYLTAESDVWRLRGKDGGFTASPIYQAADDELLDGFAAQDADGDGKLDLTIMTGAGLRVLLAGSQDSEGVRIDFDDIRCLYWNCQYAFVQADTDPEPELVIGGYGRGGGIFAPVSELELQPDLVVYDVNISDGTLSELGSQTGRETSHLVIGDFNGDGVQDLAGGGPELVVMFGKAR